MDWAAPNLPDTSPNSGSTAGVSHLDARLQKELSRLDDSVAFRPRASYLHHTWAQTFFSRPEYYFQPESIPELQKIVTLARRLRKRVCVTGYGHSPSDLTCTSSWLINLDHISRLLEVNVDDTPGLVRFEGGISLHNLNEALAKHNLTLPNLGSIDVQSVAGSISTGTHGSSLKHGLLSQSITSLTILLSNSQLIPCSPTTNPTLFRAALLSLGALGIITEITFQTVPDFNISWTQTLHPLSSILSTWPTTLWTTSEYTRVWWLPYLSRAVIWRAHTTTSPPQSPTKTFYGGLLGYYLYHNLLYLSHYIPRLLPLIERFIFGMQYGFTPGTHSMTAIEPARTGLLMDCLYSQFVNEWALPLSRGPEAIERLSAWINGDDAASGIPFSSKGVWVHCPIEVRVSDTTAERNVSGVRPLLDPTSEKEPTLYLNATLYRPYGRDPPCRERYYQAFEWLMREMGGRPHWAKNFESGKEYLAEAYGEDMEEFMKVRGEVDPDGMWVGEWHVRNLGVGEGVVSEREEGRGRLGGRFADGVLWEGKSLEEREVKGRSEMLEKMEASVVEGKDVTGDEESPPATSTSEESFDLLAKGEASVHEDLWNNVGGLRSST